MVKVRVLGLVCSRLKRLFVWFWVGYVWDFNEDKDNI